MACVLFLGCGLWAATPASSDLTSASATLVNEVLFTLSGEARTQRDMELYRDVLAEVFDKKRIGPYTKSLPEDFLLSQLASREASAFDLQAEPPSLSTAQKKKLSAYPPEELERQVRELSRAMALIEIKENQLKQEPRFTSWVDLLKRKYQLRVKSALYP